jgi:hypothetical protein
MFEGEGEVPPQAPTVKIVNSLSATRIDLSFSY